MGLGIPKNPRPSLCMTYGAFSYDISPQIPNDYPIPSRHSDSCVHSRGTLGSAPMVVCNRVYKAEETDGRHRPCYKRTLIFRIKADKRSVIDQNKFIPLFKG